MRRSPDAKMHASLHLFGSKGRIERRKFKLKFNLPTWDSIRSFQHKMKLNFKFQFKIQVDLKFRLKIEVGIKFQLEIEVDLQFQLKNEFDLEFEIKIEHKFELATLYSAWRLNSWDTESASFDRGSLIIWHSYACWYEHLRINLELQLKSYCFHSYQPNWHYFKS